MHVIAVINQKGGVGKTTTSINLSYELAKLKQSVLLVDLDAQGNTTSGLGINLQPDSFAADDVLLGKATIAQATIKLEESGVHVLPADEGLAAVETKLSGDDKKQFVLKNALESANYDYIIIDCPPSLGVLSVNALVASTEIIIPMQAEFYALEGISQLLGLIQKVQESYNESLKILGLVLTMYDDRTTLAKDVKAQLQQHFTDLVFKTEIPRNVRLAEAPSHGLPIGSYDKWSKGARAYKKLTKEVRQRHG